MRFRLSYANVMSTVACFVALGGGAYAASKIGSQDIKRNAVLSKHIKGNQVKGGDVKESTLRGAPPLAYAHVVGGEVIPSRSRGVTIVDDNVTGAYCMNVTGTPKVVEATVDDSSLSTATASFDLDVCPAGTDVEVLTGTETTFGDRDFFVVFH